MTKILITTFSILTLFFQTPESKYLELLSSNKKVDFYLSYRVRKTNVYRLTTNTTVYKYFLRTCDSSKISYIDFLNKFFKEGVECPLMENQNSSFAINFNLKIMQEYKKFGVKFVQNKYLKPNGDGEWINKPLDWETKKTLIKIMLDNNMMILFAHYSGHYTFKRIK